MNISATLNFFRLFRDPALCLPHATIPNFNHLPVPLSPAFTTGEKGISPDIRAVVLDKDNCFARPKENSIFEPYAVCESLLYYTSFVESFSSCFLRLRLNMGKYGMASTFSRPISINTFSDFSSRTTLEEI